MTTFSPETIGMSSKTQQDTNLPQHTPPLADSIMDAIGGTPLIELQQSCVRIRWRGDCWPSASI